MEEAEGVSVCLLVGEGLVGASKELLLTGVDQGRVDAVAAGQLVDGLVPLDERQLYFPPCWGRVVVSDRAIVPGQAPGSVGGKAASSLWVGFGHAQAREPSQTAAVGPVRRQKGWLEFVFDHLAEAVTPAEWAEMSRHERQRGRGHSRSRAGKGMARSGKSIDEVLEEFLADQQALR